MYLFTLLSTSKLPFREFLSFYRWVWDPENPNEDGLSHTVSHAASAMRILIADCVETSDQGSPSNRAPARQALQNSLFESFSTSFDGYGTFFFV